LRFAMDPARTQKKCMHLFRRLCGAFP
jgi:hypothetical protein